MATGLCVTKAVGFLVVGPSGPALSVTKTVGFVVVKETTPAPRRLPLIFVI